MACNFTVTTYNFIAFVYIDMLYITRKVNKNI